MLYYESLQEFFEGINYEFEVKLPRDYPWSITNMALACREDFYYNNIFVLRDYTFINVFYIYIGHLICKYGKNILESFLNSIKSAIEEVEKNYKDLDLTSDEQLKILEIARQVKDDLPKLKIFSDSVSLIEQEIKEYKNEKGLE